jgi:signal transduction histidine kinase
MIPNKLNDEELLAELRNRMSENKLALQELTILNEKLVTVNRKLEDSEKLKSHFISNIANEIVNPFTSILGLSGNLLSVKGENWEKALNMVNLIHSEAFSLDFQFRNIFGNR